MQLFDTHAHLNLSAFSDDREAVIRRAEEAGVVGILDVGTDALSSEAAVRLAEAHSIVYAATGIHPHEAAKANEQDFEALSAFWNHNKVVSVGEIGLDYHYDFSPRDVQKAVFRRQLEAARRLGKPVIVHVREAMADALDVIDAVSTDLWNGVFHCFGGDEGDARAVLDRGFWISFTGVVTFRNFQGREVVRAVPDDRLLIETDAPYMTPVPFRGKRNEPAYLEKTLSVLAEMRGQSVEFLAEITIRNALKFFGLGTN